MSADASAGSGLTDTFGKAVKFTLVHGATMVGLYTLAAYAIIPDPGEIITESIVEPMLDIESSV